jgi:methionyl-tRNA synthetase
MVYYFYLIIMYLTTAISYLNGDPHIGHQLEIVVSDVIVRYNRLKIGHENVIFQTGSDEHGQKIANKAISEGLKPIELCNKNLVKFQTLYESLGIDYNNFIRTSSKEHYATVQHVFKVLKESGDIYLGKYEGWYNNREEKYISNTQAKICDYKDEITGTALERIEEESYFFRMSKYQGALIEYHKSNDHLFPDKTQQNHILKRLEEPLQDLSISRTNFDWGVPLDNGHVCYVWFDALLNYLSGIDYFELDSNNQYHGKGKEIWQNTHHVIGKDIVWFHSVIWITMLMALKITLPKEIIVHGFVTDKNGLKMSKSIGNVIDPFCLLNKYNFPADTLRAFCVRYNNIESDTKCGIDNIMKFHNGELANNIGNLVNRLTNLIHKNCSSIVPKVELTNDDSEFIKLLDNSFVFKIDDWYKTYTFREIFLLILNLYQELNVWLTEKAPWKIKENKVLHDKILRIGIERLYQISHTLIPIMPAISEQISTLVGLQYMSFDELKENNNMLYSKFDNLKLEKYDLILFPKIEDEKSDKIHKKKNPKKKT